MIYATAISFNEKDTRNLKTIVRIKLEADESETWKISDKRIDGWFKKEIIHSWLESSDDKGFKIKVKLSPYSELESVENNGIKYVRAVGDNSQNNNLLNLDFYTE